MSEGSSGELSKEDIHTLEEVAEGFRLSTEGSWFGRFAENWKNSVQGHFEHKTEGNHTVTVCGLAEEAYLGSRQEQILFMMSDIVIGLDLGITLGAKVEVMVGPVAEFHLGPKFEWHKGQNYHMHGLSAHRIIPASELNDAILGVNQTIVNQSQKIARLTLTAAQHTQEIADATRTIGEHTVTIGQHTATIGQAALTVGALRADITELTMAVAASATISVMTALRVQALVNMIFQADAGFQMDAPVVGIAGNNLMIMEA